MDERSDPACQRTHAGRGVGLDASSARHCPGAPRGRRVARTKIPARKNGREPRLVSLPASTLASAKRRQRAALRINGQRSDGEVVVLTEQRNTRRHDIRSRPRSASPTPLERIGFFVVFVGVFSLFVCFWFFVCFFFFC